MPRILIAAAAGLGVLTLAALLWTSRTPEPENPPDAPPDGGDVFEPAAEAIPQIIDPSPLEAGSVDAIRQRIADLELALDTSIEMRRQAEEALAASEGEIEALEAYIEEIESRGEDPADYAEEGMARFQPAFMRYEEAAVAYEQAEALEQEARSALAEAKANLSALGTGGPER